jgi:hypothetical protein
VTEERRDRWVRARLIGTTILLYGMLALILWVVVSYALGRSTSNEDLLYELRYGNCLLSAAPEDRVLHGVVEDCRRYAETGHDGIP